MKIAVFDIETDGLDATKIHVLSCWTETNGLHSTSNYDDIKKFLEKVDIIVGHNIQRFDVPVLERVLGIKVKAKLVDTLALSWCLFPSRTRHGLESWGEDFGVPKPKIDNWLNLPLKEYVHRCEEDVKINTRLWKLIWNKLLAIYKSEEQIWKYIEYITFKMECAVQAEKSGWKIDVEYAEKSLIELLNEKEEKISTLTRLLPKVPIKTVRTKPKKMVNNKGSITKLGESWINLITELKLPLDVEEVEYITGYQDGNPNSPTQIKDWLFSLGWEPATYKEVKNKETKEVREIPQINLPFGKGICDSIKALYEKEPELDVLDGLSILNHRIPILRKMTTMRDKDDCVKATVQGLTNTLRFQHADPCVNLPKPEKRYAEAIRGCLIARKGKLLCGADMSSLEDRLKQHYIFPFDPDYVRKMMRDDFDPHLELAMIAKKITLDDKHFYQKIDNAPDEDKKNLSTEDKNRYKLIKTLRGIFKNGNYACQYGAYPPRLVKTCGISPEEAQELFDAYWKLNHSIKEVVARQTVVELEGEMWLLNPINHFWYSLRTKNDIFSTLIQGTASYVFDLWVEKVLEERKQLTAQFHDEIVIEITDGFQEACTSMLRRSIKKTNDQLKLNRELDIGIQFGQRYSSIH